MLTQRYLIFFPGLTQKRFLLFTDPFHKQIYQLDLSQANPSPQGIPLNEEIHFPEYFDVDDKEQLMYYADSIENQIKVIDMATRKDDTVIQFGHGT